MIENQALVLPSTTARSTMTLAICMLLVACQGGPPMDEAATDGSSSSSGSPPTTMAATTSQPPGTTAPPPPADSGTGSDDAPVTDGGSETTGEVELDECAGDPLTGDVFDPSQVYLVGTVNEGACGSGALANVCAPDDGVLGYDCGFSNGSAAIRPTDGALLYTHVFDGLLRQFQCDVCPATSARELPADPFANDLILPTPGCEDTSGFFYFLVAPDGSYLYACSPNPNTWYDAAGTVVWADPDGDWLVHLGHDQLALSGSDVVDLAAQTSTPIAGLELGPTGPEWLAWRADPSGGFWVVVDQAAPELWHVGSDGQSAVEGLYPDPPAGYGPFLESALDPDNVLVQMGWGPEPLVDIMVRRQVGGESELIYSEQNDPLVKIHISTLVTGP